VDKCFGICEANIQEDYGAIDYPASAWWRCSFSRLIPQRLSLNYQAKIFQALLSGANSRLRNLNHKLTNLKIEIKELNKLSKFPTKIVNQTLSHLLSVSKPTIELSQPFFKAK